jgi:mono/diheme cytochrome c family protein
MPLRRYLTPRIRTLLVAALAAVLGIEGNGTAAAAEPEHPGKASYLKYCGACHGPAGKGDGVAGTFMRPKPTDLTQIAKAKGGEFPFQHTMEVIDGRSAVRAHGDPDMPVWGQVLTDQTPEGQQKRTVVKGTLTLITEYLRSIQEK